MTPLSIRRESDNAPPSVRQRQRARNLRALQTERRARCWGRPGCTGSPVLQFVHAGEQEPFSACLACGERLAGLASFRPFDGGAAA